MGIDKTPCKGIYRILCNDDSCSFDRIRISPECIGCPSSLVEIVDLDGKVLNTFPIKEKEEEKKKEKTKIPQVKKLSDPDGSILV